MSSLIKLTQQELANTLCLLLTTLGILISVVSLFPLQFIDKENAQRLGEEFFTSGITLGFGVSSVGRFTSKKEREEGKNVSDS